ncbi:hypothetical protein [Paenibacillus spongiae]|uniref:Uncharacterized protein n=1 Tax=Paenibacillus spongiae TaxID=2909671 RepID=A0ABY5S647_9BACL|nr:hypothetical protein [Paenibacillus spongiae]UVI28958.1 hypothetical protein L1F29_26480 [Paenibacillus spongiae]
MTDNRKWIHKNIEILTAFQITYFYNFDFIDKGVNAVWQDILGKEDVKEQIEGLKRRTEETCWN